MQAGWNGWRKVSGVICHRLPARVKGKVYSSVVRSVMVYGLETVALTKKTSGRDGSCRDKNVEFAMGVTRKDKIRNKYIRGTVTVEPLGMKMREGRLTWCGEERPGVRRKKGDGNGITGKEKKWEAEEKILDVVKEDMEKVGARTLKTERFGET